MKTLHVRVTDKMKKRLNERAERLSGIYGSANVKFTRSEVIRIAIEYYLKETESNHGMPKDVL